MMSSSRVSSLNVVSTMPMVRSLSLATAGAVPASSPAATTAAAPDRAKAREIRDFFMIVMGLWQAPILTSHCPHARRQRLHLVSQATCPEGAAVPTTPAPWQQALPCRSGRGNRNGQNSRRAGQQNDRNGPAASALSTAPARGSCPRWPAPRSAPRCWIRTPHPPPRNPRAGWSAGTAPQC